jgi:hypothetical protein
VELYGLYGDSRGDSRGEYEDSGILYDDNSGGMIPLDLIVLRAKLKREAEKGDGEDDDETESTVTDSDMVDDTIVDSIPPPTNGQKQSDLMGQCRIVDGEHVFHASARALAKLNCQKPAKAPTSRTQRRLRLVTLTIRP